MEFQVEISGTVLERKVYSLTPAGQAEFMTWLHREEEIAPPPKDVFRLRLFFANEMTPEGRRALIAHEQAMHGERLERLRRKQAQFSELPSLDSPALGDYMVLDGAVRREEAACAWLAWCLRVLEAPEGAESERA